MRRVCALDTSLPPLTLASYQYKTSLFHSPFGHKFASIQELAAGLRTEVDLRYAQARQVILAGHSLGGVISRQFILEEAKQGRRVDRYSLALYAVPHLGSIAANVGTMLSPSHRHLRQLIMSSDILTVLNEDWLRLGLDGCVRAKYIVGTGDRVVSPSSAKAFVGNKNVQTLTDYTHSNITQATGFTDLRYLALKELILDAVSADNGASYKAQMLKGNPLFEIYAKADAPYYIKRPDDAQVDAHGGNTWLWGGSGVGKTSILRRLALNDTSVLQVTLSGGRGSSAFELITMIADTINEGRESRYSTAGQVLSAIKTALSEARARGPVTLLIEEIPLDDKREREEFSRYIIDLCLMLRDLSGSGPLVRLALSGLYDPLQGIGSDQLKVAECLNVMHAAPWSKGEARALVDMLAELIRPDLSEEERGKITLRSTNSPRVVKSLFRRWKFGTDRGLSLDALLDDVLVDQVTR